MIWIIAHRLIDSTIFVFQVQVSPTNWTDSSSFLATISQPDVDSLSTLVSGITTSPVSGHHNTTIATIATVLEVTNSSRRSSGSSSNHTALFEKNTRSQQDQCWETYVGQVFSSDWWTLILLWLISCLFLSKKKIHFKVIKLSLWVPDTKVVWPCVCCVPRRCWSCPSLTWSLQWPASCWLTSSEVWLFATWVTAAVGI